MRACLSRQFAEQTVRQPTSRAPCSLTFRMAKHRQRNSSSRGRSRRLTKTRKSRKQRHHCVWAGHRARKDAWQEQPKTLLELPQPLPLRSARSVRHGDDPHAQTPSSPKRGKQARSQERAVWRQQVSQISHKLMYEVYPSRVSEVNNVGYSLIRCASAVRPQYEVREYRDA